LDAAFHLPDGAVILTGVIFGCSRAHGPAAWAMLMDLVPRNSRVKWFPVMSAIAVTAPLLGEAISYPFLAMHLTDYTALWAVRARARSYVHAARRVRRIARTYLLSAVPACPFVVACCLQGLCVFGLFVMLFTIFVLEETLPPSRAKQWGGWGELLKDASPWGYRHAIRLWCCPVPQKQQPEPEPEPEPEPATLSSDDSTEVASVALQTVAAAAGASSSSSEGWSAPKARRGDAEAQRGKVLRVILVTSLLGAFGEGVFSLANNVLLGALHYKQEVRCCCCCCYCCMLPCCASERLGSSRCSPIADDHSMMCICRS
jgi:hypothetical protein